MKRALRILLSPPIAALALLRPQAASADLAPSGGAHAASHGEGFLEVNAGSPLDGPIGGSLNINPGRLGGKVLGYKVASWYGPRFHGRRTASGKRYDMHAMTCAHKSLPFGTILHLENPKTGKAAVVVVNDRGPYIKGRSLDLSRAAADRLGLIEGGHGRVKVTYLGRDMRYEKYITGPSLAGRYTLVVEAFKIGEAGAGGAIEGLSGRGDGHIVPVGALSGMAREGDMAGGPMLARDAVYAMARLSKGDLYCKVGLESGRLCFFIKRDERGDEAASGEGFYFSAKGSLEETQEPLKTPAGTM